MGNGQKKGDSDSERDKEAGERSHSRWWVDQGKAREARERAAKGEAPGAERFFAIIRGYDQDRAQARLTDLNLKLLKEGDPPVDGWGYLLMTEEASAPERLEQVKRAVPIPSGCRALAVDSGNAIRVIMTGSPPGQDLLELRLGTDESSFDAWIDGEWVAERLFPDLKQALEAAPAFVREHLGPARQAEIR